MIAAGDGVEATIHPQGTYVCMEGPQFSTRAESNMHRAWGADLVGMTCMPEAKLAREAEICYATLALVTDYDTWHEEEESVTAGSVIEVLNRNVAMARRVLFRTISTLPPSAKTADCPCRHALENTILTHPSRISAATRERLSLLLDRYMEKP